MRELSRSLGILVLGTVFAVSPHVRAESDREQQVKSAAERYHKALVDADVETLRSTWADDYEFTNARGEVLSKKQRLEEIETGKTRLTKVQSGKDVQVKLVGNTALWTATVEIEGTYGGNPARGLYRSMHVWAERDGKWQLLANQLTPIIREAPVGRRPAR